MNGALAHRGPDDSGVYVDPEIGLALGARRLSIIDVEGGHQPLSNEDETVWAVLNGEIYNYRELRTRLLEGGHRFRTRTDTEVLVHLYEEHGEDLVDHLEGMFAFAIWDARSQLLILARDKFGEKPLFYTDQGGELTFASELTALMRGVPNCRMDLDPVAMDGYFVLGYVPGPDSLIKGIRQVLPAHVVTWRRPDTALGVRRYWRMPNALSSDRRSAQELAHELRGLLEASVASRMISDVPVGVFLSGGLDSTLVVALAARCSSQQVKTFTVGYDRGGVNETPTARRVARALGTQHHEIVLAGAKVQDLMPAVLAALDQPLADQAFLPLHCVSTLAREEVKVVIGGEGADELFGGYPRYRWLSLADELGGILPAAVARRGSNVLRAVLRGSRAGRLADVVRPGPLLDLHLDWVSGGRRVAREALYGPRLRPTLLTAGPLETLYEPASAGNGSAAARFMRLDQQRWLPDDVLAKADRAGMLASLEIRTPYLHPAIAEFAAGVPTRTHLRGGGKHLLRLVLKDLLGESGVSELTQLTRRKTAFRAPAAEWLRGPLVSVMRKQVEKSALVEEGWFDGPEMARLLDGHLRGRQDSTSALWPLLALGLWLDRVRGRTPD